MEQQHSAREDRKGPGQPQGQGQKQGQDHGHGMRRRKGAKPRAAAAAAAGGEAASPLTGAPGSMPREARRRGDSGAVRQETAALYHAQLRFPLIPARLTDALSWLPRARLTALGTGLLAVLLMVLAGVLDRLLLSNSMPAYGSAFVLVCVACASWVRPADLFTAPVAAPLAFTAGLAFISGGAGTEGFMGHLTSLFPALAVNAVWLYGGTLIAGLIVLVRKVGLIVQRSRARALDEALEDAESEMP